MRRLVWFVQRLWLRLSLRLAARSSLDYMRSGETLPPPLNPDEEARLVAAMPQDEAAREKLIVHNLRLVVFIARRFDNTGVLTEDLISIGTIGLIKAVNTFKSDKQIKLATYASRCIENEILMYLRKSCKLKLEVSFDEPLNIDWDGNELLLSDILGTDKDEVSRGLEDEAEKELLLEAMATLNEREKEILHIRYGLKYSDPKTQKQAADMLGISQSYISRLEKRIIKQLKREMLKMQGYQ